MPSSRESRIIDAAASYVTAFLLMLFIAACCMPGAPASRALAVAAVAAMINIVVTLGWRYARAAHSARQNAKRFAEDP
jgi:hypothetical protein